MKISYRWEDGLDSERVLVIGINFQIGSYYAIGDRVEQLRTQRDMLSDARHILSRISPDLELGEEVAE